MIQIWQNIKQHPYSVFFYLVYCWLWHGTYNVIRHPMREGGLLAFAGIFTALIFVIISLINAYRSKQYAFYIGLIGFIAIPVAFAFYLNNIQVR